MRLVLKAGLIVAAVGCAIISTVAQSIAFTITRRLEK